MKQIAAVFFIFLSAHCLAQSNTIKEVQIGDQIWMAENLNVDRFRNGDIIKEAKTYEDWKRAEVNRRPAWCYFNNDSTNGAKYGKLYNFFAIKDLRGLAPLNWHIPDEEEWITLIKLLGGEKKAGKEMKSNKDWEKDGNGNNKSGFNALPGGYRQFNGNFLYSGTLGYWWRVDKESPNIYYNYISLSSRSSNVEIHYNFNQSAFSVRCIKNK
jgi:uncharacterized protein (TIGR02145 family)